MLIARLHPGASAPVHVFRRQGLAGRLQLMVERDGSIYFFHGRAVEQQREASGGLLLFEELVASQTTVALAFAVRILQAGGHRGPVDIGVMLHGIKGARPWYNHHTALTVLFDESNYRRATRRPSGDLVDELPGVLRELLDPLFQVLGQGRSDPIEGLFVRRQECGRSSGSFRVGV